MVKRMCNRSSHAKGFTLIELLVVMAILMLLMTVAVPRYFKSIDRAKEATLKQDLAAVRESLDKFYGDQSRYPNSLEELVERQYLRAVPIDPLTDSASTWLIVPPTSNLPGSVYDLHSGATGTAMDGSAYAEW